MRIFYAHPNLYKFAFWAKMGIDINEQKNLAFFKFSKVSIKMLTSFELLSTLIMFCDPSKLDQNNPWTSKNISDLIEKDILKNEITFYYLILFHNLTLLYLYPY